MCDGKSWVTKELLEKMLRESMIRDDIKRMLGWEVAQVRKERNGDMGSQGECEGAA